MARVSALYNIIRDIHVLTIGQLRFLIQPELGQTSMTDLWQFKLHNKKDMKLSN